jgi:transposase
MAGKSATTLMNEIRVVLSEYEITLPQGVTKFRQGLLAKLEQEQAKLTALTREVFRQLSGEWLALEERFVYYNEQLEAICQAHPACHRLLTIPGIGLVSLPHDARGNTALMPR